MKELIEHAEADGIRELEESEIEAVGGGILPLVIVGVALLFTGGCAGSCVTVKGKKEGVGEVEVEVNRKTGAC